MVSCFKRASSLSLLALTLSCGQNGVAPIIGGSTITITGDVTTVVGGVRGSTDGTGTAAKFDTPGGLCISGNSMFVMDRANCTVRKVDLKTYAVTTVAGIVNNCLAIDGTGTAASFQHPQDCVVVGSNLYITDALAYSIRRMNTSTYTVTTVAGNSGNSGSADGVGTAATFYLPTGIATDGKNLYVADSGNSTIRKIVLSNFTVSTFAGSAGIAGTIDGVGSAARLNYPLGMTVNGSDLYVADYSNHNIRKVNLSTRSVTTLAGNAGVSGTADGTGLAAEFYRPAAVLYLGGLLFISDFGNHTVRILDTSDNSVVTFLGTAQASGNADGTGTAATFNNPQGLALSDSALFVGDTNNNSIRKVQ